VAKCQLSTQIIAAYTGLCAEASLLRKRSPEEREEGKKVTDFIRQLSTEVTEYTEKSRKFG